MSMIPWKRSVAISIAAIVLAPDSRAQGSDCSWESFCSSTPNSTGGAALISSNGFCEVPDDAFVLLAGPVPNQTGIFFYSSGQAAGGAGLPFGNGLRCIGDGTTPLIRFSPTVAVGNTLIDQVEFSGSPITLGSTWHFQAWFRDPAAGGALFDLSDGLSVTFGPQPSGVEFEAASSSHPESGGATAIRISIDPPTPIELALSFALGGSATQNIDFTIDSSPLVIPAGASDAEIVLTALDDSEPEQRETVIITLLNAPNAQLGPLVSHTVTLTDDDSSPLEVLPASVDFGAVELLDNAELPLSLTNTGSDPITITALSFLIPGPGHVAGYDFELDLGGQSYLGNSSDLTYVVDWPLAPGASLLGTLRYAPSEIVDNELTLRFSGAFPDTDLLVRGEGAGHAGGGYLHVVITPAPELVVDYDQSGDESVQLLGQGSHTHEPGQDVIAWQWRDNGLLFASTENTSRQLTLGSHDIELTIFDDASPQDQLALSLPVEVHAPDAVPGLMARYYQAVPGGAVALLDAVPASPDFLERRNAFFLDDEGGIGGSPMVADAMVRLEGQFTLAQAASLELIAQGGVDRRVELDGQPASGPIALAAGPHFLELRFAVETVFDLPLSVSVLLDGAPAMGFESGLTHDELSVAPRIHAMPSSGVDSGGNQIRIDGFGFYPRESFVIHWGALDLDESDLVSWDPERLELLTPPGNGVIQVTVETPAGISNARTFTYSPGGPVPIQFAWTSDALMPDATCAEWGPDGRLWVGAADGELRAITFDEDYQVTDTETFDGVSSESNKWILGITFNPYDPPGAPRVLVAHSNLFAHGGGPPPGPSPFNGMISVLEGPDYDSPTPLVSGLPVSNHDHGINGLLFDHNGDLLFAVGSMTNSGVPWPQHGYLPEAPLSAAIVKALVSRPDFNGEVRYLNSISGLPDDDQRNGEEISVAPGSHVVVQASGVRNCFDLCFTTRSLLYATDNAPNSGFGPASTGSETDAGFPHPDTDDDELLLIEIENYYGHPNRSRGRYDPRQNIYRGPLEAAIPGEFRQWIGEILSSSNGIAEYRATSFGGQMRGDLLVQVFNQATRRVVLTPDGRGVQSVTVMTPTLNALGLRTGPGGAILAVDYDGLVKIAVPVDLAAIGLTVYDITPWRAPSGGGGRFVIGGEGFGTLADTTVEIAGIPAVLTEVSPRRIVGVIPTNVAPTTELEDVLVSVGTDQRLLPAAFRYLFAAPGMEPGKWTTAADAPVGLSEIGAGVIDGVIYTFGRSTAPDSRTFAYDIAGDTWVENLAPRTFAGDHHSVEVWGGKLYLIGGLGNGATGRVQIYDPQSDSWSLGADMPWWGGGSVQTAQLGGLIHAAGGISANTARKQAAVYDPASDTWSPLPDMEVAVSHAAAGTDGIRFFVFGGRGGPGVPVPGLDLVQVYDPATGLWSSSTGGAVAPIPAPRGGTGKAVWYGGELYIFGGETDDPTEPGVAPGNVFPQVHAYRPATDSWRQDADMPLPTHGHAPVAHEGRIFIPGGAPGAGTSASAVLQIFSRQ